MQGAGSGDPKDSGGSGYSTRSKATKKLPGHLGLELTPHVLPAEQMPTSSLKFLE